MSLQVEKSTIDDVQKKILSPFLMVELNLVSPFISFSNEALNILILLSADQNLQIAQ